MLSDLRIGSRTSPMALAQAWRVRDLLRGLVASARIVGIRTSGDRWEGELAELGGKGAFLREIDRMLVEGRVDVAVHCLKDVPGDTPLPEGTTFAAFLERDDVHDVLLFPAASAHRGLPDLPIGARVGTSSVRRTAQLLRARPDLDVAPVRGNVNSRIERLDDGPFDAMVLARAGLRRIGMEGRRGQVLPLDLMCPAVGAGVIALRCRADDRDVIGVLRRLDHAETRTRATAERAMLRDLRGHCNSPIAGHCVAERDRLALTGMVFAGDGTRLIRARRTGDRPDELGADVAAELLRNGAREIIDRTKESRGRM